VVKEITVVGSRCGPFTKALAFLRSGKIDPTPLITRTFPLTEAGKAIRFAQQNRVMKVLLKHKRPPLAVLSHPNKLQAINAGRDATRAKAVVNIHNRDVGGATIQHAEERGNAAEAGTIASAGRTAITGTPTSPPTTLGRAPSMPATQMMTRAEASFSRCSSKR